MADFSLTIDDLAASSKIPSRTIRFYQTKGLLPHPELRGRVAFYGPVHLERLKLIAELQDRGLQIKAIGALVARVEKGELGVQDWLGLEQQLLEPWAADTAQLMTQVALVALTGPLPAGRLAELVRVGLVERSPGGGDAWLVPSPALLQLALRVEATGVSLEVIAEGLAMLRKRLARAATDLADLIFAKSKRSKKGRDAGLARVLKETRPAALEAVRLIFAQEMEREFRKSLESGRATKI